MRRILRSLAATAIAFSCTAELTAKVANVDAALPPRTRSGERVRFVPEEIRPLQRLIQAEGRGYGEAAELAQVIHSESRALHIDPLYALALIKIESGFRADAVSGHGARGLLQVRPLAVRSIAMAGRQAAPGTPSQTAAHAVRLADPRTNVALGLRYLQQLERQFDDEAMALTAYNIGPTRVRHRLERGAPVSRTYADRVLQAYHTLAAECAATALPALPPSDG
ncbi:MAG TPA: transglycosylase SLT domain-containing protein [Candidatus Binatia bacterium]|jgi:soluble lytic murein transglycosylase-like protein